MVCGNTLTTQHVQLVQSCTSWTCWVVCILPHTKVCEYQRLCFHPGQLQCPWLVQYKNVMKFMYDICMLYFKVLQLLLFYFLQLSASEFYSTFNGVPFSSIEPDCCCHLVFVSRVELLREGGSVAPVAHTELPTCPVCLERMDESVDGILTILCNHSFHSSCLAKWGDTRYLYVVNLNNFIRIHTSEFMFFTGWKLALFLNTVPQEPHFGFFNSH